MAIRLTGGADLAALMAWSIRALDAGAFECEVYVNPHGWFFRAPGVDDFVIEPDNEALRGDLS